MLKMFRKFTFKILLQFSAYSDISASSCFILAVHIRFCPDCKNDTSDLITAGEKLKLSKKKSKMMSNINKECTRDWGKVKDVLYVIELEQILGYCSIS